MKIDEAITRYKEKAEFFKNRFLPTCAKDYEQLAEWLEELKAIKGNEIPIIHGKEELELHDKEIRNKAIDDFAEVLKSYTYGRINGIYVEIRLSRIDEIAQQLKAGGTNGNSTTDN